MLFVYLVRNEDALEYIEAKIKSFKAEIMVSREVRRNMKLRNGQNRVPPITAENTTAPPVQNRHHRDNVFVIDLETECD